MSSQLLLMGNMSSKTVSHNINVVNLSHLRLLSNNVVFYQSHVTVAPPFTTTKSTTALTHSPLSRRSCTAANSLVGSHKLCIVMGWTVNLTAPCMGGHGL